MDKDEFLHLQVSRIVTNQLGVDVGVISLNRPDALNALNYPIINGLQEQLERWAQDDTIEMVIIKGNGPRAYCAGGDIKALYEAGDVHFLADEYRLDEALYRYPKPIVHLLHGFVMGGGMGLMASGALKLCTSDAEFAMPEAAIGFFPDVGYRYHLARMPLGLGAWLGLTGARFTAPLAQHLGVVDHILPYTDRRLMVSHIYDFISAWSRKQGSILETLTAWAQEHAVQETPQDPPKDKPEEGPEEGAEEESEHAWLEEHVPQEILRWADYFWSLTSVPWYDDLDTLVSELGGEHSDLFSPSPLAGLSPLSIAVTSQLLRRAATQSLDEVFNEDYWCAAKIYKEGDLREGVRARVIERRPAKWQMSFDQVFQGGHVAAAVLQAYEPPKVMAAVLRKKVQW